MCHRQIQTRRPTRVNKIGQFTKLIPTTFTGRNPLPNNSGSPSIHFDGILPFHYNRLGHSLHCQFDSRKNCWENFFGALDWNPNNSKRAEFFTCCSVLGLRENLVAHRAAPKLKTTTGSCCWTCENLSPFLDSNCYGSNCRQRRNRIQGGNGRRLIAGLIQ